MQKGQVFLSIDKTGGETSECLCIDINKEQVLVLISSNLSKKLTDMQKVELLDKLTIENHMGEEEIDMPFITEEIVDNIGLWYIDNEDGQIKYKTAFENEIQVIERGMGATSHYGADCYPHTIVDFKMSKTGRVTIWVSSDDQKWIPDTEKGGDFGHYEYTSNTDATRENSEEVKLWTKHGKRWSIGFRRFYLDPSF